MKKAVSPVTGDKDKSSRNPRVPPTVEPRAEPSATAVTPDGRSSRWAAHRAARREELIDAAVVAISRHGAAVGMDQIASVANTSKPVIYRYFADKNDLYRAVSQRVVATVLTTLVEATAANPEPRELIHAGVDAYLGLARGQSRSCIRFVAQHPLDRHGDSNGATATDFSSVVAELISQQLATHLWLRSVSIRIARPPVGRRRSADSSARRACGGSIIARR